MFQPKRHAQFDMLHPDVMFVHKDAIDLSPYSDRSFYYTTLLMLIHELPGPEQILILNF